MREAAETRMRGPAPGCGAGAGLARPSMAARDCAALAGKSREHSERRRPLANTTSLQLSTAGD